MFSFETPPRRDGLGLGFFLFFWRFFFVRKLTFQQFSLSEKITHARFPVRPRILAVSEAESKQADGEDRGLIPSIPCIPCLTNVLPNRSGKGQHPQPEP